MLLKGIRVLDLSHTLAGPFTSMLLADLGAEVIKVEPPEGDETRSWTPLIKGFSAYFASINRGKKSIVVDLKSVKGREIIYKLVKKSHIVIENYRPGVRERLGVDPETLFLINPNIVYCSIKGFGLKGTPYRDLPAYDIIIQAMSGVMTSTGFEGEPPVRVSFALFDVMTGYIAAYTVVSTLLALRQGSIKGPVYIEVPMYDVAIFSMVYIPMIFLLSNEKPKRMGSAHPSIVPYQAFRASDGKYFIVAAANDKHWRRLCEAIGLIELANDPRFKTNPDRVRNRDALINVLSKIFSKKPRDYWVKLLISRGIPAAPVYEIDEVFNDPHVRMRKLVVELDHPLLGKIKQIAFPISINDERPMSKLHPPLKGEHSREILKWLGYSDEEIEALFNEGVVA